MIVDTAGIRQNLEKLETRIGAACARAGRRREEITLVAVSKTFPAEAVDAAVAAGIRAVGENRVQEARAKKPSVSGSAEWHLIGHLQSNKAKEAAQLFDWIQTIDSAALADRVARFAETEGKRLSVLLQVNVGGEEQKNGVEPAETAELLRQTSSLKALDVRGLMTIPPAGNADETRRCFRELRTLRDELGLQHLSMGMSEDFEIAIEEGATMIRVGRAIFGSRG